MMLQLNVQHTEVHCRIGAKEERKVHPFFPPVAAAKLTETKCHAGRGRQVHLCEHRGARVACNNSCVLDLALWVHGCPLEAKGSKSITFCALPPWKYLALFHIIQWFQTWGPPDVHGTIVPISHGQRGQWPGLMETIVHEHLEDPVGNQ